MEFSLYLSCSCGSHGNIHILEMEEGREKGQEAASSGQLGGLLGQAGSVQWVEGDFRESESYCCR